MHGATVLRDDHAAPGGGRSGTLLALHRAVPFRGGLEHAHLDGAGSPSAVVDRDGVMEPMAVGCVALDPDWPMTQVNDAAARVLGRPAHEFVGRDLWEEFPGARELEFGPVHAGVTATRRPASFDAWYPGLRVWFELRVPPRPTAASWCSSSTSPRPGSPN